MHRIKTFLFAVGSLLLMAASCSDNNSPQVTEPEETSEIIETPSFYYGADLSYVNEMENCGAIYKDANNINTNPYKIFKDAGANLVRVRLWHNPTWTDYSDYSDVKKTIQKAKDQGMRVLLDFHYSDTWTDPSKQKIPAAWESEIDNKEALGELLYNYTYETLNNLALANLLPEMVQIGNEINPMILQGEVLVWPIDWDRNSYLINKGIKILWQQFV